MRTIDIIGSCISREIFNSDYAKEHFGIQNYFLQNSITTMFYPSLNIDRSEIIGKSDFITRILLCELNKKVYDSLKNKHSGTAIIDFADCRNVLYKVQKNGIMSLIPKTDITEGVVRSLNGVEIIEEINPLQFLKNNTLQIDKFCEMLNDIYGNNKVVLNRYCPAKYYIENDNIVYYNESDQCFLCEEEIKKIENRFLELYGDRTFVIETNKKPIGDPNHFLGKYPLHYNKYYYDRSAILLRYYLNELNLVDAVEIIQELL